MQLKYTLRQTLYVLSILAAFCIVIPESIAQSKKGSKSKITKKKNSTTKKRATTKGKKKSRNLQNHCLQRKFHAFANVNLCLDSLMNATSASIMSRLDELQNTIRFII